MSAGQVDPMKTDEKFEARLRAVEDDDDEFFRAMVAEAASKWSSGTCTAPELLEDLGPLLTDPGAGGRRRGIRFLADVLGSLPPDYLRPDELGLLIRFFVDRLKNDHHSLHPAVLDALSRLLTSPTVEEDDLALGLRSMLNGEMLTVPAQLKRERMTVYRTAETLLSLRRDVLVRTLGSEFVLGFMQSVDGEKDPANLRIVFGCWPVILRHFPLDPFTEDVFETLACYFPIDFTPPPGLSGSVTREDLITDLRRCLSAEPSFAPLAIPMFMEKLESDLDSAKLDANLTFLACLKSYGSGHLALHLDEIWPSYKKEILGIRLKNADPEVKRSSLEVLTSITRTLASDLRTTQNRQILDQWLDMIWGDCGRHLKDIELKLMALSVDVFSALADDTGDVPVKFVLERTVPVILETMVKTDDVSKKTTSLKFIAQLLKGSTSSKPDFRDQDWLADLVHQFAASLSSLDIKHFEEGCGAIAAGMHFINDQDLDKFMDHIIRIATEGNDSIMIPDKTCDLLELLMARLDRPKDSELETMFKKLETEDHGLIVAVLDVCGRNPELFKNKIYPRIVEMIMMKPAAVATGLKVLNRFLTKHQGVDFLMQPSSTFEKIFNLILESTEIKEEAVEFLKILSPRLAPANVKEVKEILKPFYDDSKSLRAPNPSTEIFVTFIRAGDQGLLNELDKNGFISPMFAKETDVLFQDVSAESLAVLRSSVLNKMKNPDALVGRIYDDLAGKESMTDFESLQLVWIVKGLALKPFYKLDKWIELIVKGITKGNNRILADGIRTIVTEVEDSNPFYKHHKSAFNFSRQKIFFLTKESFLESYNATKNPETLKALVSQLPNIPKFVLASEMAKLLPLFKSCLQTKEEDLLLSSLNCLKEVVGSDVNSFSDDLIPSLLPMWLDLATEKKLSIRTRIMALECVQMAGKMESKLILVHRRDVIVKLNTAVDDHKRLVRKAASNAKNLWCMAA